MCFEEARAGECGWGAESCVVKGVFNPRVLAW